MSEIRRGDVIWVAFGPTIGSEIRECRPAIVVSSDDGNLNVRNSMLLVVPMTGIRPGRRPRHYEVTVAAGEGGLTQTSRTVSNQVRAIDRERITRRAGRVSPETLDAVDERLQQVLALA